MIKKNVALVLGGTGGIGTAITRLFAKQGIKVYATYYRDVQEAKQLQDALQGCTLIQCDIQQEEKVQVLVRRILEQEGQIDILINTVTSPLKLKLFENISQDEFTDDINTILIGAANVCRQVVPLMKKNKGGVIVSLGTIGTIDFPSRMSSYISAKAGLLGLTRCLATECAAYNLRIVSITPSFVETPLIKAFPEKLLEIEREKQPEKQFLQPEDIAMLTFSIINDSAKYPNGTEIVLRSKNDLKRHAADKEYGYTSL